MTEVGFTLKGAGDKEQGEGRRDVRERVRPSGDCYTYHSLVRKWCSMSSVGKRPAE